MTRHAAPTPVGSFDTAAWHAPAVQLAASAPAFATSLTSDETTVLTPEWGGWSIRDTSPRRRGAPRLARSTGWATPRTNLRGSDSACSSCSHSNLPTGAFTSWASNRSPTRPVVVDVSHSFVVSGTVTVSISADVLLQPGASGATSARQTLRARVVDPYAGTVDLGGLTAARPELRPDDDEQLVAQGYSVVPGGTTSCGCRTFTWNTAAVDLVLLGDSSSARTVEVVHTFELHPVAAPGGGNDRMALHPPTVVARRIS
ncbi:hypothetical protein [Nocardioides yefusunii]|uniref:Uncharacterized protein n=1 Tax=Nocardioides yefusunii TaxID=2500546 RepID=A0ABW1QZI1_9ACTN|nr:hypothetical protein [Nocardioides yefusunii]